MKSRTSAIVLIAALTVLRISTPVSASFSVPRWAGVLIEKL